MPFVVQRWSYEIQSYSRSQIQFPASIEWLNEGLNYECRHIYSNIYLIINVPRCQAHPARAQQVRRKYEEHPRAISQEGDRGIQAVDQELQPRGLLKVHPRDI